jgi:hypothetical protein
MADHGILIQNKVAAFDVGSYNRSVVAGSAVDIDNGNVFRLDSQSSTAGQTEVWAVTAPTTSGSTMNGLWMAATPEVPITWDGTLAYKGLNQDPRRFYNKGAYVFDAFKLVPGDIITVTADNLDSSSVNTYANSSTGVYTLAWSASTSASSLNLRYLKTTYISIGSGAIDNQRKTAYKFEVIAN